MTCCRVAFAGLWWSAYCTFLVAGSNYLFDGNNEVHPSFIHRRLRTHEKREMQKEILSILGLPHRPRPHVSHGKYNSAPLFMLDLYKSILSEEKNEVDGVMLEQYQSMLTTQGPSLATYQENAFLNDADMVMSFVNLGMPNVNRAFRRRRSPNRQGASQGGGLGLVLALHAPRVLRILPLGATDEPVHSMSA
ncbi:unnamed protein product [Gadus morhua 'NCC']